MMRRDRLKERGSVMDRVGVIHYAIKPGEVPSVCFPVTLRPSPFVAFRF